ncbi:hypothetical protein TSUD_369310 [Trifolium subterraneum]|uniref:Uncharacterized protein n=1 Tax=Trifolium subterraneum TaxID=3900 RepID=A0A2Z6NSC7_TRISU|nr:hypothetical protein TSUD_369310 [Trifolium subterraneum]
MRGGNGGGWLVGWMKVGIGDRGWVKFEAVIEGEVIVVGMGVRVGGFVVNGTIMGVVGVMVGTTYSKSGGTVKFGVVPAEETIVVGC